MSAVGVLWSEGLRSWLRARGLWLVLAAALIPPILTGSWALTHQDDIEPTGISFEPESPRNGDNVTLTATVKNGWDHAAGPFNATVEVGYFEVGRDGIVAFRSIASESERVPRLAAGESHEVNLTWRAQGGTYIFQVRADTEDEVAELEENNNHFYRQVTVRFPEPEQSPPDPAGLNGTLNGTAVDLAVTGLSWTPPDLFLGDEANVTVTVENRGSTRAENATVLLNVYAATLTGFSPFPGSSQRAPVSLEPGATTEVVLPWRPAVVNGYALQGTVLPPANTTEAATDDNRLVRYVFVDREFLYEPPEERATAKAFYHDVLGVLHIRLLLPVLALFYAGTILDDERRRGSLDAVLTRPVPRWMLPVVRSLQGFLVTAAAVAVGVLATFVLLLGLPQAAPGYLAWPLLLTLLALFAYGGLFTLLGVAVERPHLWGLTYVLGVETLILAGRSPRLVTVNGEPLLQEWVSRFSLADWMRRALEGWDASAARWTGGEATTALLVVAAIGVGGLVAAAVWMTRREFPE